MADAGPLPLWNVLRTRDFICAFPPHKVVPKMCFWWILNRLFRISRQIWSKVGFLKISVKLTSIILLYIKHLKGQMLDSETSEDSLEIFRQVLLIFLSVSLYLCILPLLSFGSFENSDGRYHHAVWRQRDRPSVPKRTAESAGLSSSSAMANRINYSSIDWLSRLWSV